MAEFTQAHLSLAIMRPNEEMMRMKIVHIILSKFLKTTAGHVQQLYFHFRTGLTILATLYNVLLARASSLNHLIHRAVAMGGKKTFAELHRKLIDGIALSVEIEILPDYGLLQDRAFCVVLHGVEGG